MVKKAEINNLSKYIIYSNGEVYSKSKNKIMLGFLNKDGYMLVRLVSDNGKVRNYRVHRLVAKAFIPNPNNYPVINHKDENKLNNDVSNLEWCTYSYNNSYGNRINNLIKTRNVNKSYGSEVPIVATNIITGEKFTYKSQMEASRKLNISQSKVSACLQGRQKKSHGYTFKSI